MPYKVCHYPIPVLSALHGHTRHPVKTGLQNVMNQLSEQGASSVTLVPLATGDYMVTAEFPEPCNVDEILEPNPALPTLRKSEDPKPETQAPAQPKEPSQPAEPKQKAKAATTGKKQG